MEEVRNISRNCREGNKELNFLRDCEGRGRYILKSFDYRQSVAKAPILMRTRGAIFVELWKTLGHIIIKSI